MKIDKESLIKYISNLKISRDISIREIERQSGVYNVSRILSGEIKNPTAESWQLLHEAFPADIPEPHYVKGGKVFKNVSLAEGAIAANGSVKHAITNGMHLSPEEQSLINALREFGEQENRIIRKILATIDNLAENLRD